MPWKNLCEGSRIHRDGFEFDQSPSYSSLYRRLPEIDDTIMLLHLAQRSWREGGIAMERYLCQGSHLIIIFPSIEVCTDVLRTRSHQHHHNLLTIYKSHRSAWWVVAYNIASRLTVRIERWTECLGFASEAVTKDSIVPHLVLVAASRCTAKWCVCCASWAGRRSGRAASEVAARWAGWPKAPCLIWRIKAYAWHAAIYFVWWAFQSMHAVATTYRECCNAKRE